MENLYDMFLFCEQFSKDTKSYILPITQNHLKLQHLLEISLVSKK